MTLPTSSPVWTASRGHDRPTAPETTCPDAHTELPGTLEDDAPELWPLEAWPQEPL